jgi:hypothetical protein
MVWWFIHNALDEVSDIAGLGNVGAGIPTRDGAALRAPE